MFTSDVCWGSLSTSIFGNLSSAANNTRSRLPSKLSFRFLWLWSNQRLVGSETSSLSDGLFGNIIIVKVTALFKYHNFLQPINIKTLMVFRKVSYLKNGVVLTYKLYITWGIFLDLKTEWPKRLLLFIQLLLISRILKTTLNIFNNFEFLKLDLLLHTLLSPVEPTPLDSKSPKYLLYNLLY